MTILFFHSKYLSIFFCDNYIYLIFRLHICLSFSSFIFFLNISRKLIYILYIYIYIYIYVYVLWCSYFYTFLNLPFIFQ
ncbi:hypothetical protein PFDG_04599 [Plasmodium falciparum Dd2]|uniref:Uncharacterized protein n=1 Tax=Plasmodium falciparum (isolate Dd2) TaxID=57267 RepID=A0A0L7M4I7_PLAF4|nr:hypothetical protein PFDG_03895 [Plasmodium falciparum Dd2]KOB88077.1 hypothetical protein PFDG_04599 [Plasmodium falciparum Dd2]